MTLIALETIKMNGRRIVAGSEFEATESQAEMLLGHGWAKEAVKKEKAPKKAAKKK